MTNSSEYLHALFGLDDQVAVVIGGTGVLGGALCDGIAQAGAKVIVAGRSPERGEQRVASIRQAGGQAVGTDARCSRAGRRAGQLCRCELGGSLRGGLG